MENNLIITTENNLKIYNEKIITKKSRLADSDDEKMIINHIVKRYEYDEKRVFKNNLSADDKIDSFLWWKNMLFGIIITDVTTLLYEYTRFSCTFIEDNGLIINLNYILFENKLIDVSCNTY